MSYPLCHLESWSAVHSWLGSQFHPTESDPLWYFKVFELRLSFDQVAETLLHHLTSRAGCINQLGGDGGLFTLNYFEKEKFCLHFKVQWGHFADTEQLHPLAESALMQKMWLTNRLFTKWGKPLSPALCSLPPHHLPLSLFSLFVLLQTSAESHCNYSCLALSCRFFSVAFSPQTPPPPSPRLLPFPPLVLTLVHIWPKMLTACCVTEGLGRFSPGHRGCWRQ